jgi:predicted nucleic acid-binding protein
MVVVDNSVVLPLFISDEDSSAMENLIAVTAAETQLLVPRLWVSEFGNGLLVCTRRGRISQETALLAHEKARRLPLQISDFPEREDLSHLHLLAEKHQLSFYDASYLALAVHRGAQLASNDKQLSKAAENEGILYPAP